MTPDESPEDLMSIATFSTMHDAELAQARLEELGIRSFISRDDAGGAHPELQFTQGVRLMVRSEASAEARQVLDEIDAFPGDEASEIEEQLYEAQQRKMWRDLGTAFLWLGAFIVVGVAVGWYATGSLAEVVGAGGFVSILAGGLLRLKGAEEETDVPKTELDEFNQ